MLMSFSMNFLGTTIKFKVDYLVKGTSALLCSLESTNIFVLIYTDNHPQKAVSRISVYVSNTAVFACCGKKNKSTNLFIVAFTRNNYETKAFSWMTEKNVDK